MQLCDNWVSIGSSNLDRWNQHWNLDANQEIDDTDFAKIVESTFLHDWKQSIEMIAQLSDRQLRVFGLASMIAGVLMLVVIRG